VDSNGKIVVCLVGFRNVEDVMRCLPGLAAQTYAEFEVVICENGGQLVTRVRRGRGAITSPFYGAGKVVELEHLDWGNSNSSETGLAVKLLRCFCCAAS